MSRMKKNDKYNILFLSYYYPPIGGQGLPGSQRSVKFIKYLKNFRAVVLTIKESSCPNYYTLNYNKKLPINSEIIYRIYKRDIFDIILRLKQLLLKPFKKVSYNDLENSIKHDQSDQKSTGMEVHSSYFQKFKDLIHDLCYFPDNASGWILPAIYHGRQIVKKEKIDIIFATGMPWSSLVAAYFLHLLTGIPYIIDFRDPWVGNPYQVSKGTVIDNLQVLLERKIVRSASIVCANTELLRQDFLSRYSDQNEDKFITLPNGFDINEFQSIEQDKHAPNNKQLILAHAGLLYKQRDPLPIYMAFEKLISEHPELKGKIKFLQIGDVQLSYDPTIKYKHLYELNMLENIGSIGYQACLKLLSSADIMVIIQPETLTQVPSKLYDYLCLNKPILTIAHLQGELSNLIRKHHFGFIVEPNDLKGLESIILQNIIDKDNQHRLTANYNDMKLFDARIITEKLEEKILSTIILYDK